MLEVKPIPYSQEAEQACLGAVLIDSSVAMTINLRSDEFYLHKHRFVWDAMSNLRSKSYAVDTTTVTEELDRMGKLDEIGGASFLAGLTMDYSPLNIETYVKIVKDKAGRRKVFQIGQDLAKAAYDESQAIDNAVINATTHLTGSIQPSGAAQPLSKYVQQLMDDVAYRADHPSDIYGLETTVLDFDKITGGLQPGEVLYIGGEPGIGKSILSMQMGIGMATKNHPGAIYSLEMKGLSVTRRIVSELGEIDTKKLKSGKLLDADWPIFYQACETASALPVFMSESSYWTMGGLRADMARLKQQHKIEWFVLDYLLLVSDGDGKMDEIERSALLSKRVKMITKEFDLAGITVNSVTKDGADIRGSNQVKHDADVIMMLVEHQPDPGQKKMANMRTAIFKKGREMADPKTYFHLIKADSFPAFRPYYPENKPVTGWVK
jgi:replicative DNA helicase